MRGVTLALVAVGILASAALPANGQDGWKGTAGLIHLQDAGTVGRGKLIFSLGTSYYKRDETLTKGLRSPLNGTDLDNAAVDYHFFVSRAALTLGLSDYVEFSAGLQVRNWIMVVSDDDKVTDVFETRTRGGIGDTDVLLKLCPPVPIRHLQLGVLGYASFPTGKDEAGFTTGKTDFGIKGLATVGFTDTKRFIPTKLHVNAGYKFDKNEDEGYGVLYANNPDLSGFYPPAYPPTPEGESANYNDLFTFGAGLEFLVKESRLFVEFAWDKFLNVDLGDIDTLSTSSYTITPGVSLVSKDGVGLTFAADFLLNSEDSRPIVDPPDWMLYLMLSFGGNVLPQDRDKDGIDDDVDKCPDEAEDIDGFEDADGCPDLDNDKDGIPDATDKCPNLAEDFDGFQDEDGCPDLDNDNDGIPDVRDKCPTEPEDFDGVQDEDGCPDVVQDTDNDGIADDKDKCPLVKEDFDNYQDEDGCPDPDNDLDGIADTLDKCPSESETYNGYMDDDGCPDTRPIEEKFVLRGVNFESGSAALTPDSYAVLDQVVKSLKAYPEVRVEIAGHTDNVGKDDYNLGLSQRRADSVKQYLVNAGIAADRIVARGYGESSPIAPNATAAGRAENRRIEFRRLN